MKNLTATSANKTAQMPGNDREVAGEIIALDRRYGQIGISAVAAAVRYQGTAKNPAYAPVSNNWRDRFDEAAA